MFQMRRINSSVSRTYGSQYCDSCAYKSTLFFRLSKPRRLESAQK